MNETANYESTILVTPSMREKGGFAPSLAGQKLTDRNPSAEYLEKRQQEETDKLFKSVFGTIVFIAILCIIAAMNTGCTATVKVHPIYLSDSDQDWEPIGYGMTRDIEVEDEAKK